MRPETRGIPHRPSPRSTGSRSRPRLWVERIRPLDLIVAIGLGVTPNPGPLHLFQTDPSGAVLTGFPLALFPTFFVPLSMLLHVLSLRYLLGARTAAVGTGVSPATHLKSSRY